MKKLEFKPIYITVIIAVMWGLSTLLLLHGALFHNQTLRNLDVSNGLEVVVALVSFGVLVLWLWYMVRLGKKMDWTNGGD
jgi:divalent metal cation (Fe/Co/Zn/Cd) transporter